MSAKIEVSISNKENLILKLIKILEKDDYCCQEPLTCSRLEKLLKRLKKDVWFVLEYPYVDKHYRDTYYSYYSSKLKKIGRDCIRVHIFQKEITKDDLIV
jgi:hypothetical protein